MSVSVFELACWVLALALIVYWMFPSDRRLDMRGQAFAGRYRASVSARHVPAFRAQLRTGDRITGVFLGTGMVASALVPELAGARGLPRDFVVILWIGMCALARGMHRLRVAGAEFLPTEGTSAARIRRVTLADYLPFPLRWSPIAAMGVAAVAAWWGHRWAQRGEVNANVGPATIGAAGVVTVVALLVTVFGPTLARRRQPASDSSELYLSDAWRAESLSIAYLTPLILLWLLLGGLYTAAPPGAGVRWLLNGQWAGVVLGFTTAWRSRLRFRRRLWSALSKDHVLMPGDFSPTEVSA